MKWCLFWFNLSTIVTLITLGCQHKLVQVAGSAYEAAKDAHALVICTEWDEFKTLDFENLYQIMDKPAYIFDGRKILDHERLIKIGFIVETIGKKLCNAWPFFIYYIFT